MSTYTSSEITHFPPHHQKYTLDQLRTGVQGVFIFVSVYRLQAKFVTQLP